MYHSGIGVVQSKRIVKWDYYASPEGVDLATKTLCVSSYATLTALTPAYFDVLYYSQCKNLWSAASRLFGVWIGPACGAATAFSLTTFLSCRLRGKDDRVNYVLGGIAAGPIFGAWCKSGLIGFVASVCCGVAGLVKKDSVIEGYVLFPEPKMRMLSLARPMTDDWTLTKDEYPKGYTTNPNEV